MLYIYVILFALCTVCAAVWLIVSLRNIARRRMEVEWAGNQLVQYSALRQRARDEQEKALVQEQVEISREIYHNVVLEYNLCLVKPFYLIPARILGYRPIREA